MFGGIWYLIQTKAQMPVTGVILIPGKYPPDRFMEQKGTEPVIYYS